MRLCVAVAKMSYAAKYFVIWCCSGEIHNGDWKKIKILKVLFVAVSKTHAY